MTLWSIVCAYHKREKKEDIMVTSQRRRPVVRCPLSSLAVVPPPPPPCRSIVCRLLPSRCWLLAATPPTQQHRRQHRHRLLLLLLLLPLPSLVARRSSHRLPPALAATNRLCRPTIPVLAHLLDTIFPTPPVKYHPPVTPTIIFCSGQPLWLPATTPRRTFTLKVVSLSPPSYQPNIMPHSC